jgi:hypothetical protein
VQLMLQYTSIFHDNNNFRGRNNIIILYYTYFAKKKHRKERRNILSNIIFIFPPFLSDFDLSPPQPRHCDFSNLVLGGARVENSLFFPGAENSTNKISVIVSGNQTVPFRSNFTLDSTLIRFLCSL